MDQHKTISPDVTYEHHIDSSTFKKRVIKTTVILSVVTLVELGIGIILYFMHKGTAPSTLLVLFLKGAVCILTLAKAYYIVSVFMHLGDEIRSFKMTIVIPLLLFIWFIIAFLWDGSSFRNLRNTYDKHFLETTTPKPGSSPITPPAKMNTTTVPATTAPADTSGRQ